MRKINCFHFFLLLISLLLSGCQSNETTNEKTKVPEEKLVEAKYQEILSFRNNITVKMEKEEYLTTDNQITLNFQNKSDEELIYGAGFTIEQKVDGKWYYVLFKEGTTIPDIGYILKPHETKSETYSLESLKNKLSPGKYRLIQRFGATSLAAPFEVIKP
ncbi:immunoglobulin-like domain-containing protein [Paenisporosarcina sp. FSL H8-0542]|uniref:immunoglobulin-like domain-containing protein n=1 Tax=Paenisporosarcina sp. FSL H8-0542 TaxID=2921401 RepID=UPI00315B2477